MNCHYTCSVQYLLCNENLINVKNTSCACSLPLATLRNVNTNNHFSVILEKTIRIPRSLSVKAASVLKGFLNKNPGDRLGCHRESGFFDIVNHAFFKSIDWELVSLVLATKSYWSYDERLLLITNEFLEAIYETYCNSQLITFINIIEVTLHYIKTANYIENK